MGPFAQALGPVVMAPAGMVGVTVLPDGMESCAQKDLVPAGVCTGSVMKRACVSAQLDGQGHRVRCQTVVRLAGLSRFVQVVQCVLHSLVSVTRTKTVHLGLCVWTVGFADASPGHILSLHVLRLQEMSWT